MNVLLILTSNSPEDKWNCVRFGNTVLNEGDEVAIFLNGEGVDLYSGDSEKFPIAEQAKLFGLSEGTIHACGKCLDLHGVKEAGLVKRSNMKELYELMKNADKIINY